MRSSRDFVVYHQLPLFASRLEQLGHEGKEGTLCSWNGDTFDMEVRKVLKKVGITSQLGA